MKRLSFEMDYRGAWREIFGKAFDKLEILEATKCIRCDSEKFAIICRIRLSDPKIGEKDLVGTGALTNIETLYREKNGSLTVFLQGKWQTKRDSSEGFNVVQSGPPKFVGVNKMNVELLGTEAEVQKYLRHAERLKVPHRILALTSLQLEAGDQLDRLTPKQRSALLSAYGLGYYDVPRRISSEQVASRMRIDKSTLVEHMRKAEKKLLDGVLAR